MSLLTTKSQTRWSCYSSLSLAIIAITTPTVLLTPSAYAQNITADTLEEVVVTGSRIRRNPLAEASPVQNIELEQLDQSGLTNLGQALQQLPITGSAVNSRFNVPGNSGFPQDGSGIGAGATQLALRNVSAKRTLILVDGRRWCPAPQRQVYQVR